MSSDSIKAPIQRVDGERKSLKGQGSGILLLMSVADTVIISMNGILDLGNDRDLEGRVMKDPIEELKKIVKDTGRINSVYGGFEIEVISPRLFPWHKLLNQLIEIGLKGTWLWGQAIVIKYFFFACLLRFFSNRSTIFLGDF